MEYWLLYRYTGNDAQRMIYPKPYWLRLLVVNTEKFSAGPALMVIELMVLLVENESKGFFPVR